MVADISPSDPPTPPTLGIGQNSAFSEHGNAAYQIKGNHEMQQHGSKYFVGRPLPTSTPLTRGLVLVMFNMKLKKNTNAATW